jgi:DNA helicase-2/ATP-dependent DNA helicase PcrA
MTGEGGGSDGVDEDSRRLRFRNHQNAQLSFSRAKEDLRVLLFTTDPEGARAELINSKLLEPDQIRIVT